ncbi:MAG: O-antigen polymerase, partial [Candidatus Berkelbacteria bacterium Licking1014_85]
TLKINHLIGAFLIIYYFLSLVNKKTKLKFFASSMLILAFIFSIVLSMLNSQVIGSSAIVLLQIIFCALLFQIIASEIDSERKLDKVIKILKTSAWIVIIFALWQFVADMISVPLKFTGLMEGYSKLTFGFPRVQAFSREPLFLGNYLFLPLAIFIAEIFSTKRDAKSFVGFAMTILIIILTISRGAIIGLGVFFILLAIFYPRKIFKPKNLSILVTLLLCAGIGLIGTLKFIGPEKANKFIAHIQIKDFTYSESVQGRLSAYKQAIDAWKTSPIIGIGLMNFGPYSADYNLDSPWSKNVVNNQYLEILAEEGLVGIFIFTFLIIFVLINTFYAVRKNPNGKYNGLLILLTLSFVGVLAQYNFLSTLPIIYFWVYLALIVAMQQLTLKSEIRISKPARQDQGMAGGSETKSND